MPEFGNRFYTLDSVSTVIPEMAFKGGGCVWDRNWHPYECVGFELLPAAQRSRVIVEYESTVLYFISGNKI